MSHRKNTAQERKVKNLLLSGYSRNAIASEIGIPKSTVYTIVDRLISYGQIRAVPGTKNPVVYEDPFAEPPTPPTEGCDAESWKCTLGAQNSTGSGNWRDTLPKLSMTGISATRSCPEGYVAAHMTGGIRYTIREIGNFDAIKDPTGCTCGYWESKPKRINGVWVYSGEIRMFSQEITFNYRVGDRGGKSFMYHPGRIFLDPSRFTSLEEAMGVFIDRALYFAALLRQNGWQLTDPVIKGEPHYAIPDSPLVAQFVGGMNTDSGDITVDTSKGVPEAEMTDITDWERVQIFANLPTAVQNVRHRVDAVEAHAKDTDDAIGSVSRVIVTQQTHLDSIIATMDRVIDVQEKVTTAFVNIAEQSSQIAQAQTNINMAIASGQQRTIDNFSTASADDPSTDGKPANQNDTARPHRLEGYQ